MAKKESPCLTCTRVKFPQYCENEKCGLWRKWFREWWDEMRRHVCQGDQNG